MNNQALIREYEELLRTHGVEHLVRPSISPEQEAEIIASIKIQAERSAADWGETNHLARFIERGSFPSGPREPHDETAQRIEKAVRAMGFELPGPVHVGEYPHQSFNAQACAMKHGTLLLINTGLKYLLMDVALALSTKIMIADRAEDGAIRIQETTEAMRGRARNADEVLARSLASYIMHTDSRLGGKQDADATTRGFMSFLFVRAAETFAVAHEYGHFLAGHLNGTRSAGSDWLQKSHDQEFEADEIGMLLAFKAQELDEGSNTLSFWKHIAVAGAFLFFGIDHLLNRVRSEVAEIPADRIVSDHPPSDARVAALRRTLTELEGPDVFQLADANIMVLAGHEDRVIENLRKLMRGQRLS